MANLNHNILGINKEQFEYILRIAASQEIVKKAVLSSHENSTWWPVHVKDWRVRMLIAGLSARISYRTVYIYREIVDRLDFLGYDRIANMSESEFEGIISRLGLKAARINFWKSFIEFLNTQMQNEDFDINNIPNDKLIYLIQKNVKGASYKLAQCCVLYGKGYYCGVMPVDSGMKDMIGPCLGFPIPPGSYGHEHFRKQLEKLTALADCRKIAADLGYSSLNFPKNDPLTWWAHIVLISYKRFYCNNRKPQNCPFYNSTNNLLGSGSSCSRSSPELGGIRVAIIEGIDGAGKSTLSQYISGQGYCPYHFGHIKQNKRADLLRMYNELSESAKNKRVLLDRSFISEFVYGPVLRNKCRLTKLDAIKLLNQFSQLRSVIIYLYAPKDIILNRLSAQQNAKREDLKQISLKYSSVMECYDEILELAAKNIPVLKYDTSQVTISDLTSLLF